ncbi:hypothetical protein GCM10017774_07810 [Lentzea cavernae]|uniref:Secreted protein n=1 Tax=Lentzea cavernae TaxID=2020703 RepID=A0ABQ3M2S0_9PSEU|nr:hypothetical protein GCM10017774_07810 [Lentzea cavernae]
MLLPGGVVVTIVTVWDVDVRGGGGGCGAATGEPGTAVPQPATRAASSTTACLAEGMAGTLSGPGGLGYRSGERRPEAEVVLLQVVFASDLASIDAFS